MCVSQLGMRVFGGVLLALPLVQADASCGELSAGTAEMRQLLADVWIPAGAPVTAQGDCQVTAVAAAPLPATAGHSKQAEFDNAPYRFNMVQNGRLMSADDFDLWLRANGYHIGRRVDAGALAQHVPQT